MSEAGMPDDDLDSLIDEYWSAPAGPAREAAALRAAAHAEQSGDPGDLLETRLLLARSRHHVPTEPSHLALHAWLIAQLDTDVPTPDQRYHILWIGKWAMTQMLGQPDVPLAVITDTFADLERRIRLEGYTERAVAEHRIWLAQHRGDSVDQVRAAIARWQATPRDDLSDCLACEANAWGQMLRLHGDLDGALAQWQPVVDGELSCSEEPHRVLARAADVLARVGRPREAVAAHQRGWRLVRGRRTLSGAVANQLMFLVRAGQPGRALELLAPCHDWADGLPDPSDAMGFHAVTAAVLRSAVAAGDAPDRFGSESTTVALEHHAAAAAAIAARFDLRNGSRHVSDRLRAEMDPTPYVVAVPLPGVGAPSTASVPGIPGSTSPLDTGPPGAEPPDTIGAIGASGATEASGATGASGADVVELAAAVRRAAELGDLRRGRLLTRWAGIRRTGPDHESAGAEVLRARAELDRWLALDRAGADDGRWDDAVASAEASRDADELALTEAHRAALRAVDGDITAGRRAADLAATLEIRGAARHAAEAHRAAARVEGDDQLAHLRRAIQLYEAAGDDRSALLARVELARLGSRDDPGTAAITVEALLEQAVAAGHLRPELEARSLLALMRGHDPVTGDGDPEAAEELFAEIADRAAAMGIPTPLVARVDRTMVASLGGDPELLAEASADLVEGASLAGQPRALALARHHLGQASLELGDPLTAVQALEDAAATWREGDSTRLGPTVWLLGQALAELGDLAPAAEAFREAASAAEAEANAAAAGEAWWQAGTHALQVDPAAAEADLERALAIGVATGDPDLELRSRRAAAAAAVHRDPHVAVGHLDAVIGQLTAWVSSDLLDEESSHDVRISLDRQAAECYARAGEWVAALDRIRAAEAACGIDHPDELRAAQSERAMYLAACGRVDEAEALLVPLLPELDLVDLHPALATLCRALAEIDRESEADALWSTWIGSNDDEDDAGGDGRG